MSDNPRLIQVYIGPEVATTRARLQRLANVYADGNLSALFRALADDELLPRMLAEPLSTAIPLKLSTPKRNFVPVSLGQGPIFEQRKQHLRDLAQRYTPGKTISSLARTLASGELLQRVLSKQEKP